MSSKKSKSENDRDDRRNDDQVQILAIAGTNGNDKLNGTSGNDTINGGKGNDRIDGGAGNDIIDGDAGNDNLTGGSGTDTFTGGAGNDNIDGGSGLDVAIFSGKFSDYKLTLSRDGGHTGEDDDDHSAMTVHDLRSGAPDGVDVLKNVEVLKFADGEYRDGRFHPNGPVAPPQTADAVEGGTAVTVDALFEATDPNGDPLTVVNVPVPANLPAGVSYDSDTHSFKFDPTNAAYDHLAANASTTVTVNYGVSDGMATTPTSVSFVITGTNDAPVIAGTAVATVREDITLSATGTLSVSDADAGESRFQAQLGTAGTYGSFRIDANGVWTYDLSNSAAKVQALITGQSVSDAFTVTTADGTTKAVVVTVQGTNDAATISGTATGGVVEAGGVANGIPGTPTTRDTLAVIDVDAGQEVFQTPLASTLVGTYGNFTFNATTGVWGYTLDQAKADVLAFGEQAHDTLTVKSVDGSATQTIEVAIAGSADGTVIGTPTQTSVTEDANVGALTATGIIPISFGATFTGTVPAPGNLGTFALAADGSYIYSVANSAVQYLGANETKVDSFTITSNDLTTKQVSFTINGTNDAAVIGPPEVIGTLMLSSVTEDAGVISGKLTATGIISITDADAGQNTFKTAVTGAAGNLGTLAMAPNGAYLYTVANSAVQYLGANDSKPDNFTITSADGTTKQVSFTIQGANDAAVISGKASGSLTEAGGAANGTPGIPMVSGTLTDTDVDNLPNTFQAVGAGTQSSGGYGTVAMTTGGVWTYALDNTNAAVQGLNATQTLTDTFTVRTADGTPQVVTITINGANDAAVIGGTASGLVTEAGGVANETPGTPADSDTLTDADVDNPANTFQLVSAGTQSSGGYGTVAMTTGGVWTYTLNNANATVQGLNASQTLTDTFTVRTADGTPQVVTITINGANDAPVITANYGVTTLSNAAVLGSVSATDVDGDTLTYSLDPSHPATLGTVTLATDGSGSYTYTPGSSGLDEFNIIVSDGHGGSTTAAVTANVTSIPNLPDDIVGATTGFVIEAGGASNGTPGDSTASGELTATDSSTGTSSPTTFIAVASTLAASGYGRYSMTSGGVWTYTLDDANATVQGINTGSTLFDTFTVRTADGTAQDVTITINGANDAAMISGTATGAVVEAGSFDATNSTSGTPTASGNLNATDVDNLAAFTIVSTPAAATHGTYTIDAGGNWSYALNNADAAVQSLNAGDQLQDTFTVTTADYTAQSVTITINGANDAPLLAAPAAIGYIDTPAKDAFAAMPVDIPGELPGELPKPPALSATDFDAGATLAYGIAGGISSSALDGYNVAKAGVYGTLYLNTASGEYRFAPDSIAINALEATVNDSDTFTLTVSDGAGGTDSQTLTVNLHGENDASVISGVTGPLQYTVAADQVPVLVAPDLTLGDVDSGNATSAIVAISGGYTGNEVLGFNLPNSPITGSFDIATGELTFSNRIVSGSPLPATLADYEAALASVTFLAYSPGGRTVSFTIYDGPIASETVDTSSISLESLTTTGFRIPGEAALDGSGGWVSTAGDINGDGYADMIVGAPWVDADGGDYTGRSYVIFGKPTAFDPEVPLWSIDGNNGFRLTGEIGTIQSQLGFSVSTAGDVNGDGFADFIMGSPYSDDYAGASYVVFGQPSFSDALDSNANVQLSTLGTVGSLSGFRLSGENSNDQSGQSVSAAGDVNGDGFADIIIGAPWAEYGRGAAYVVFGNESGFSSNVNLSTLDATGSGFRILGELAGDAAGMRVSAAGDVDGDGFADVVIGAPFAGPNGTKSGASYVVFGKDSGFSEVQLSPNMVDAGLPDAYGFRLAGRAAFDENGYGVSAAGDMNGDGFGDLIVSSFLSDANGTDSGAAYVVFGNATRFTGDFDLSALNGTNGFRIVGGAAGDVAGYAASGVGDVNGDGYDDVIIGAPGAGGDRAGSSYVVFGRGTDFPATLDLATIGGADGFEVSGVASGDDSGYAVSGAGDINGDGFDDMMVSSAHASPHDLTTAGESYVIFGARLVVGGETYLGGSGNDTLTGAVEVDPSTSAIVGLDQTFIGGQGNDTMLGNGGKDAFAGGAGDDTIHLGAVGQSAIDFVKINGGTGFDTLALDGSNARLDFTAPGADRVESIERIDLTGSGNNTLVLDIRDLLNMSDSSNQLFVKGDVGDAVISTAQGWGLDSTSSIQVEDAPGVFTSYNSYTFGGAPYAQGMANLLIDVDLLTSATTQIG